MARGPGGHHIHITAYLFNKSNLQSKFGPTPNYVTLTSKNFYEELIADTTNCRKPKIS